MLAKLLGNNLGFSPLDDKLQLDVTVLPQCCGSPVISGLHQCSPAVDTVLFVYVGALLHHKLHHFQLATHRRHHEG